MDNTEDKDILTQTTQEVSGATSQAPAEAPETTPAKPPRRRSRRIPMAVLSLLFTVGGWLMLPFEYRTSLVCGILGFLAGLIGWCARRGAWRNLSITCTVAALALLAVFATFWGAISYIAS